MKKIYLLFLLFLFTKIYGQVSVSATGGIAGPTPYTNLKAAFDAINIGTHTGQITINIVASTVETATAQLNATGSGGASYTAISIAPIVLGISVSATIPSSMITFNGASNVTVNGNNNLTLINTSPGGNTITYINDANKIAIKNTAIKGATSSTTSGVVFFSTGVTTGNDFNTLDGCSVDGMSLANSCLYSFGTTTTSALENSDDTLRNCNFFDNNQTSGSTYSILLNSGNTDWYISGNSVYQTVARISTVQGIFYGIVTLPAYTSDQHFISGNFIGGNASGAIGTMTLSSTGSLLLGFIGMDIETGGPTNIIQNNTIRNVSLTVLSNASSYPNTGIFAFIGGYNGTTTITNNTITNFNFTNNSGFISVQGINVNGRITAAATTITPSFNIVNNNISNLNGTAAGTSINVQMHGIRLETSSSASATLTATAISNPTFTVTGNSITALTISSPGTSSYIRGIGSIQTQGTGATALLYPKTVITSNTMNTYVSNSILESASSGTVEGIHITGSTGGSNTTDVHTISQNVIYNLSSTQNTDLATSVIGIEGNNGIYTITRNKVYDLKNAAIGVTKQPNVIGLNVRASLGNSSINNNFVTLGTGETANVQFFGIINNFNASFPINVYFNSILVTGTGAAGNTRNSTAFMRGLETFSTATVISTAMDLKDNLFINLRTGGTGSNYSLANLYTTVPTNFTSNYNDLYSSNPATVALWGATAMDFATYKTTSGQDANSVSQNVTFVNPATGDLHLAPPSNSDANLRGIPVTGITIDYDGQPRSPTQPFKGADEGAFALPVSIEYFKGAKQGNSNVLNWKSGCRTTSITFEIQKSTDAKNFSTIGNISASRARCEQPFDLTDNNPFNGINYYRLKKIEIDGQVTYSIIVAIINKESGFEIVGLLPNIVTAGSAILNVTSAKATSMKIVVSNIEGRIIQAQTVSILTGSNTINMDLSKFATGSYQLTGYTNDGFSKTIKFVKQ